MNCFQEQLLVKNIPMFSTKFKISEFHVDGGSIFVEMTGHALNRNAPNFRRRKTDNGLESELEFQTLFSRAELERISPLSYLSSTFSDDFIHRPVIQRRVIMK